MLSILGLAASLAAASAAPKSHLVISQCDGGERSQFEVFECPVKLHNTGNKPIVVSKGEAQFESDSIDNGIVVKPGSTAYLNTRVRVLDEFGYTLHRFRFSTDEPGQEMRGSNVKVFVVPTLDQHKPVLDFGVVPLDKPLPTRELELSSRDSADFKILGVMSKPDYLDVSISGDGRTIKARVLPTAPWGVLEREKIKLSINAPRQKEAWVTVDANFLGDVVPDANPYSFGLMRTGTRNEFLVRLSSRGGKSFRVGKLELDGIEGTVSAEPCVPAVQGCSLLRIVVSDAQPTGRVFGRVIVELPDSARKLPVQLVGMLLPPDYPVHDMNKEMESSNAAEGGATPVAPAQPAVRVGDALRAAVTQEPAMPPGKGPLLRWSVANEKPIYGYMIYRADREEGPYVRINESIIRTEGAASGAVGKYAWRDDSATAGKTYWYSIGTIRNDGSREDLTTKQKVVAK
ncbi:MAG: hypothetical protein EOP90_08080 [Lysobacteraceae bacterium]|nr:MAG: hypothetical protein EOP90_08080 [Xanthomonadaceae bacterium]